MLHDDMTYAVVHMYVSNTKYSYVVDIKILLTLLTHWS